LLPSIFASGCLEQKMSIPRIFLLIDKGRRRTDGVPTQWQSTTYAMNAVEEEALTTAIIEGDDLRLQALLDGIASPPQFDSLILQMAAEN
jgi:hypothetical protein